MNERTADIEKENDMRVMVMVKGDPAANEMPKEQDLAAMGAYNQRLVEAGIMIDGDGLKPSRYGKRIQFGTTGATGVTDGPFSETKELIAGFWVWQVKDMDEALDWAKQAPFPDGQELELRPFAEAEDFGEEFTPELQEQEAKIRELAESNANR